MEHRSKQQLEDARERNDLSGRGDQFFDKLKSNGYEPLPNPKRFRIGWILKPVLTLGIIGGVLYYGYMYMTSDSSDEGTTDGDTTTQEERNNTADDKDTDTEVKSEGLSIEVESNISIGNDVKISYALPSSFSGDDLDSTALEIHLLKEDNSYAGFIGVPEFSKKEFIWNPKRVYENTEESVVKAPAEGQYKLVIALRDANEKDAQLSEIVNKEIGDVFDIEYDRLSIEGDTPFASCYDISEYKTIGWYSAFKKEIEKRDIKEGDIKVTCYSPKASLVAFVANKDFAKGHPTIMRFLTETESLSEAVYTAPLTNDIDPNHITVGKRKGSILPIIINGSHLLNYDFLENVVRPA